jgi:23S rRNA pseudouridine1911/1915/1917 synthase
VRAEAKSLSAHTFLVNNTNSTIPKIQIVYEDDNLMVIDKPSGLLTHPVNRQDTSESVVSWLLREHPEVSQVQDEFGASVGQWVDLRPGIVHRLDKETSGLLLIAKNQPTFNFLKKSFQERTVTKIYMALVYGTLKNQSGIIDAPIGKLEGKQTTQIKGKQELKEKSAITEYKVLKEFEDYTLVEVSPKTGRTHQIRVHMKSIGHPIVCDPLYSGKNMSCPAELGRLFLHAQKLSFLTPEGQALTLEIDLPPVLSEFLAHIA